MAATLPPTLEGYKIFIRQVMGIPVEVLPDDAPIIEQSYELALTMVNPALMLVSGVAIGSIPLVLNFRLALDARGPDPTPPDP